MVCSRFDLFHTGMTSDARFGREDARLELSFRLVREPVADADGILAEREHGAGALCGMTM